MDFEMTVAVAIPHQLAANGNHWLTQGADFAMRGPR